MLKESDITIVDKVSYNELIEQLQEKVAVYLSNCMFKTFDVLGSIREYKEMLSTLNPEILFFMDVKGNKRFEIIADKNNGLASALGENLAAAAKWDNRIMEKVIKHLQGV